MSTFHSIMAQHGPFTRLLRKAGQVGPLQYQTLYMYICTITCADCSITSTCTFYILKYTQCKDQYAIISNLTTIKDFPGDVAHKHI